MTVSTKKYMMALASAAVLALGLYGCGGGGGSGPMTDSATMMPDDSATMMPDDSATMMPDDSATMMPDDSATMMPDDSATMMPDDSATMMPDDSATMMPDDGDTMTGTPVDVERESSEKLAEIFANATHFEPSLIFSGTYGIAPAYTALASGLQEAPTEPSGMFRSFHINRNVNDNPVDYDSVTIGSNAFTVLASEVDISDTPLHGVDVYVYGGWMDYNYFETKRITGSYVESATSNLVVMDLVNSYSLGSESGSDPLSSQGSATWQGAAVGAIMGYQRKSGAHVGTYYYTYSQLAFNSDATITVDFSDENIDVIFDNFTISDPILEDDEEGRIDDIEFLGVPYYFGRFDRGIPITGIFPWAPTQGLELNEMKGIEGSFYGPNHEEVGGTFFATTRRPVEQVIVGAFGAERQ